MDALGAYLTRLTITGFRPQTIRVRGIMLRKFADTVPSLVRAERADIERFLARPLSPASRRAYASHLRSFYRFLQDEGLRSDDPTERLPKFRVPKALPRPVTDAQLALALEHADMRMRVWLLLMSQAGLRCIEVAGLAPRDLLVNDTGPFLHLRETKGGAERIVPAHEAVVMALRGMPVRGDMWWNVTARYVSNAVGVHLRSLGIDATAHQLRHWAGTTWIRVSGHDLLTTANLLGHVVVTSAQVYAKLDPARPAEVVGLVKVPA